MTLRPIGLAAALAAGLTLLAPATADAQARCYGAEDGYDDDEFGWGPAYRCDTTFPGGIGPIAPRVRAPVVVERRVVRKRSAKAGRRAVVR